MKINPCTFPLLSVCLLIGTLISTGCQKADEVKKDADKSAAANPAPAEEAAPPKAVEPPPKPTIPETTFSEQKAKTNVLNVGDAMPNAALPDVAGRPVELHSLFGKKLTVVCFWNSEGTSGPQALSELDKYIAKPYAPKGVAVIGINQGDPPRAIQEKVNLAEAQFPILQDPVGNYFKKVAASMLPRIYLLDAGGKILWFDAEYSRGTRRDLEQGIDAALDK